MFRPFYIQLDPMDTHVKQFNPKLRLDLDEKGLFALRYISLLTVV